MLQHLKTAYNASVDAFNNVVKPEVVDWKTVGLSFVKAGTVAALGFIVAFLTSLPAEYQTQTVVLITAVGSAVWKYLEHRLNPEQLQQTPQQ